MACPDGRFPYEIFGQNTGAEIPNPKNKFLKQLCPYIGDICKKPRKSNPEIKIGCCTVGYKTTGAKQYRPVIICPYRFYVAEVFTAIENFYFPNQSAVWIPEVQLGLAGSIDYVVAICNGKDKIEDFICVEIQAGGTTGTPWNAVKYYRETGRLPDNAPLYGINWANEYVKTLMQQLNKKGEIISAWGRKIVVVLQDVGMEYIRNQGGGIRRYNAKLPIQFFPFKLDYSESSDQWHLAGSKDRFSASMEGVRQVLTTNSGDITEEDFREKIIERGKKRGLL